MDTDPQTGRRGATVSVVVSTAHRPARHVRRLVEALHGQPYRPLEVVLVVGPGPDDLLDYVAGLRGVKVRRVAELNLARSRNLGVEAASGEVLAFIDDDAVPSPTWLGELVRAFESEGPACGAVGGATLHADAEPAPRVQNRNAVINAWGQAHAHTVRLEPADHNGPEGPWFNRLHGCNMAFRRGAVEAVGGFDEAFLYQHEETDLCVRLIRAGWRVVHHPRALVDHRPASSHFRRDAYDISYYNIMRSYTYFALKHAGAPMHRTAARVAWDHHLWWPRFARWVLTGEVSPRRGLWFAGQWLRGFARGLALGRRWRGGRAAQRPLAAAPASDFLPLPPPAATVAAPGRRAARRPDDDGALRLALLCGEYGGPAPGGIASYTGHLAEGLAALGHDVTVVRMGRGPGSALPKGCRVVGVPDRPDRPYQVSVLRALRALHGRRPFDLIEAPLWGGEGAAVGVADLAPLVVRLETPLEVVRGVSGLPLTEAMTGAIAAERLGLSYASGVIAISRAIAATVEDVYDARLANHARLAAVIPIGLPAAGVPPPLPADLLDAIRDDDGGDAVHVLYLGRLEARKGILELGRAFASAAAHDPRLRLWVAGGDNSGPDGHHARTGRTYPETLRELWGPDLCRRVRFLGRVGDGVKEALIARCDVFAAPSLYESFGIVFLEAMRRGKPVIGPSAGGVPEVVDDGRTGLLVPPGDADALASALLKLAADAGLRRRLGAAGLARFESHFTAAEFARRSAEFYREVIAHRLGEIVSEVPGTTPETAAGADAFRAA